MREKEIRQTLTFFEKFEYFVMKNGWKKKIDKRK